MLFLSADETGEDDSLVKIEIKEFISVRHAMQMTDRRLTMQVNGGRIRSRAQMTFRTQNGFTVEEEKGGRKPLGGDFIQQLASTG